MSSHVPLCRRTIVKSALCVRIERVNGRTLTFDLWKLADHGLHESVAWIQEIFNPSQNQRFPSEVFQERHTSDIGHLALPEWMNRVIYGRIETELARPANVWLRSRYRERPSWLLCSSPSYAGNTLCSVHHLALLDVFGVFKTGCHIAAFAGQVRMRRLELHRPNHKAASCRHCSGLSGAMALVMFIRARRVRPSGNGSSDRRQRTRQLRSSRLSINARR